MSKNQRFLIVSIFLAVICLLITWPSTAQASFCSYREDSLQAADIVFSGRVLSITKGGQDDVVLFDVIGYWRGVSQPRVVVYTGASSRDCGRRNCSYSFSTGRSYLVFAYNWEVKPVNSQIWPIPVPGSAAKPWIITDSCSRTELLSSAQEDLLLLGSAHLPATGTGSSSWTLYLLGAVGLTFASFGMRWLTKSRGI